MIKNLESIITDHHKKIFLSSVTVSELYDGVYRSLKQASNEINLMRFLSPFDVLDFESKAAKKFGEIRHALESKGKVIGPYDLQIAAVAIVNDCTLVTNNTKEFERIENLSLENWV